MGAISPLHLALVLVIALFVIGPGKLPETGAAIGKALREFRHAATGEDDPKPHDPTAADAAPPEEPQA
jgi:sec-independent protein translocase protein TatA